MSRCIRNGVTYKRHNRTKTVDGAWQPCIHCGQSFGPQASTAEARNDEQNVERSEEEQPVSESPLGREGIQVGNLEIVPEEVGVEAQAG